VIVVTREVAGAARRLRSPSVARVLALGMTFAFSLVVGRTLGPSGAGTVYAAVVGASALGMLARFGTEYAVLRHGSALFGRNELTPGQLHWAHLLRVCLIGSIGCSAAALVALYLASPRDLGVYAAFALSIPFQCIGVLASALLRAGGMSGRGAFAEFGLAQGIAAAITAVLGAADAADPTRVGLAFTGSWVLVGAWASLAARRAWQTGGGADEAVARPTLGSLGAMMSSSLLFYLLTWSPIAVLMLVATQTDVAWFGAAARFPTLIALVPTIQLTAGLPIIASHVAGHRLAEANEELRGLNRRASVIALVSGAALVAAAPLVVSLFGPGFEGAATVLVILVAGQVGAVLLGPASILPLVTGYERHAMVALCVTLPGALVAETLLGLRWGAAGAAAGWSIAICAFGLAMAITLRRGAGITSHVTMGRLARSRRQSLEHQ
jgi:O-antigen/teichoic acid export membrane protein